jgi:hypothetical protein
VLSDERVVDMALQAAEEDDDDQNDTKEDSIFASIIVSQIST